VKNLSRRGLLALVIIGLPLGRPLFCGAEVTVFQGTVTIPTYPWQDDVNPQFWAMDSEAEFSKAMSGSIVYPYTMQDHLIRTKVDRVYKALFLENEYLKITCLPELGGRLHSVLDKTQNREMFHLNGVIKPGMIAMRGAWISGGVEWNTGPHGHTVGILSPVDVLTGTDPDGSAYLEINNQEKIFRTRWTVRVTLHPGKAYLDERIRIFNPTDGMHPYYFWNCTAFPNRPGTRFIYPMTLGTDHNGREFFSWPVDKGKDLSWLKNYETYASVFSVNCTYDFFGAYETGADRGIVQAADHRELSGKKAWTWGQWDFGRVSQLSLSDEDDPYIEVQSGPLPTQSDYGMLGPREQVTWQEYWYPVHGLGDGFEFATRDVAVRTSRAGGGLELRLLGTGEFPGLICDLSREGRPLLSRQVDLSPQEPAVVSVSDVGQAPVEVLLKTRGGHVLAAFTTPLPIPEVLPPDPATFVEKPDEELTVEELYLKGRKFDRATDRLKARQYYEKALARDASDVLSLRALAVLDFEAGLYADAAGRLERALARDSDDGLSWYFLGLCGLRTGDFSGALDGGYRAARCFGTTSLGFDLAGRAYMRLADRRKAVEVFSKAVRTDSTDGRARDHLAIALLSVGNREAAFDHARRRVAEDPTDPVPRALLALEDDAAMQAFVQHARDSLGEPEFSMIETSLAFAELGLAEAAARLLLASCVEDVPPAELSPLVLYYLAYYASLGENAETVKTCLERAAVIDRDLVFASRPQAVDVLRFAVQNNAGDARAHLHLGNLYANLGRLDEAVACWGEAARLNPKLSMAPRNLGLYWATSGGDLPKAAAFSRTAIAARGADQTLHRDLAEILIGDGKRPEAIRLLETMPHEGLRRADILVMLAKAYVDEGEYGPAIGLLESTPYFVNWEGQDVTWSLFNKAHVARGQARFEKKDYAAALEDFQAALTYPDNLGVGRSNKPEEAAAQYWRGKTLEALGRAQEARAAWTAGAALAKGSDTQNEHRKLCGEALEGRK
jgi:tetratricopeptide (TPR) repeat protein